MNPMLWPWVEIAVLLPLFGAVAVRLIRETETEWHVALTVTALSFLAGMIAWIALLAGESPLAFSLSRIVFGRPLLIVDRLNGPLLPLVALLHLLTILTTARVKMNRMSFTGHLIGESIRLATFACIEPWPFMTLLALGTIPPGVELWERGKPTRLYWLHMVFFIGLMFGGWMGWEAGWSGGPVILMIAVLIRCGTFPAHLWVSDLFRNASFGTAILFATPIAGVYATLRLVLPVAPDWVLQSIGIASQITAVYAAGLAMVQIDARRFFACLFLSHASLVLIGLELHTAISLSGALGLWVSAAIALTGLALMLRGLEARYGRLNLLHFQGLYTQTPTLAVGFLLMGLGCVGFPGTLGFIAVEVLVDSVLEADLSVGIATILATALNGIAIVRAYLLLFTGPQRQSAVPVTTTLRERVTVLVLCSLILGGGLAPQLLLEDRRHAADTLDSRLLKSKESSWSEWSDPTSADP